MNNAETDLSYAARLLRPVADGLARWWRGGQNNTEWNGLVDIPSPAKLVKDLSDEIAALGPEVRNAASQVALAQAATEAARDQAFTNADVYPDEASGRAAVADGEQFQALDSDGRGSTRYERVSAESSVPVAAFPTRGAVDPLRQQKLIPPAVLALFKDGSGGNIYDLANIDTYPAAVTIGAAVSSVEPVLGTVPLTSGSVTPPVLLRDTSGNVCLGQPYGDTDRRALFSSGASIVPPEPPFTLIFCQRTSADSAAVRKTLFWQRPAAAGGDGNIQITANNRVQESGSGTVSINGRASVFIQGMTDAGTRPGGLSCEVSWPLGQANTMALICRPGVRESEVWVNGVLEDRFTCPASILQANSYIMGHPSSGASPDDGVWHGRYICIHRALSAAELATAAAWVADSLGGEWPAVLSDGALAPHATSAIVYQVPRSMPARRENGQWPNVQVLYAKSPDIRIRPASTTKVLTALTAARWVTDYDQIVTVESVDAAGGSGNNLSEGDRVSLRDLAYNLMVASSNVAANVIARVVGQSILDAEGGSGDPSARFVSEMQSVAAAAGMTSSSIANPSGLNAGTHRMTARDLANMCLAALNDAFVLRLMETRAWTLDVSGPAPRRISISRSLSSAPDDLQYARYYKGGSLDYSGTNVRTHVIVADAPNGDYLIGAILEEASPNSSAYASLKSLMESVTARYRWSESLPRSDRRLRVDALERSGTAQSVLNLFRERGAQGHLFDPGNAGHYIGGRDVRVGDVVGALASVTSDAWLETENEGPVVAPAGDRLVVAQPLGMEGRRRLLSAQPLLMQPPCTLVFSQWVAPETTGRRTVFWQHDAGAPGRVQISANSHYNGATNNTRPDSLGLFIEGASQGHGAAGQPLSGEWPRGSANAGALVLRPAPELSELWINGRLHDTFVSPPQIHQSPSWLMAHANGSDGATNDGVLHGGHLTINRALSGQQLTTACDWASRSIGGPPWAEHADAARGLVTATSAVCVQVPTSGRARLLDDYSDVVTLFETGADAVLRPASMTKVLTAQVMLDWISPAALDDTVTVQPGDATGGSGNNLLSGDIVSWRDLLHNMMLPSSNVATSVVARLVGDLIADAHGGSGGRQRFVDAMNEKARAIGMLHSRFENASGLNAAEQLTTARDMARMTLNALNYPALLSAWGRATWTMHISGPQARQVQLATSVVMVAAGDEDVLGGKTGTLGSTTINLCLYSQAPNGNRLVSVVMLEGGGSAQRYVDMRAMLDRVHSRYRWPFAALVA